MTILRRKTLYRKMNEDYAETYRDIYNWKFMRCGKTDTDYGKVFGTIIKLSHTTIFVPHFDINQIMDLNQKERSFILDQYFHYITLHSGYKCAKCNGTGKTDWIEKLTTRNVLLPGLTPVGEEFERDDSHYYIYPGANTHVFSKCKLRPGEEHCSRCKGFGQVLDGRLRPFRYLKDIRNRLFSVKNEERI